LSWKRERKADVQYPILGRIVTVNGLNVHALVIGEGPDLVLIHGSSGNIRDFTLCISPELAKKYRAIMFDRPGFGHSDGFGQAGETIKEQALLLRDAARFLGAEKPVALGQSPGGAVALAWATEARANISALVTVSGVSHPWSTWLEIFYKLTSYPPLSWLIIPILSAFATENATNQSLAEVLSPKQLQMVTAGMWEWNSYSDEKRSSQMPDKGGF
jgi:pimeloyl-ACP methyl ester carboxylesterase